MQLWTAVPSEEQILFRPLGLLEKEKENSRGFESLNKNVDFFYCVTLAKYL